MTWKPLGEVLVVRLDPDAYKHMKEPDKIIVPDAFKGGYKKRAQTGVVINKGKDCKSLFKIGDRVRFQFAEKRPGYTRDKIDYRFVLDRELQWVQDA